ncbi:zinc-dependent peptidase [Larkinella terrae]|uniref:Peptidase n=1 Tax=Larkinella terrae TaxID=2025311 RepID=A0A7K0EMV7_9BACT|nr:M90 family metallopeptidase [Larkinella terrae]MRS62816.1 peptidase [Larkinella terrae]
MAYALVLLAVLLLGGLIWNYRRRSVAVSPPASASYSDLLEEHVAYYRALSNEEKAVFEQRVDQFLSHTRIEGVGTTVDELDRVLVASSAVITIFGFKDWSFYRLTTVLLYDDRFNTDFETSGKNRNILGMVGEGGALQSTMALSKPALHEGFANETSKENTGIHEFVHLLDKADGSTDGAPEYLLDRNHLKPWLQLIHASIADIQKNRSDINPYATTNEAEFFAVVSEYFFKRPDLLKEKHPELFATLEEIFQQRPGEG